MKVFLKKVLIVLMIVIVLLPTLFSGMALADSNVNLTIERAGNYVANFAINFYENWSSENYENVTGTYAANSGNVEGTGEFIWPVPDSGRITGHYGYESGHTSDFHDSIDIAAPMGTTIVAADSGTIVEVRMRLPS